jgi:signal peptidase I
VTDNRLTIPGEARGPVEPVRPATAPNSSSPVRAGLEWVVVIVGALLVALVVKTFLFQAFYIPSVSMDPTLKVGDRVLVNKLSYDFHDVRRGDIVVFKAPPGENSATVKDLIKRVIGLPGETVESRDGHIVIDGQPLKEPYLHGVVTGAMEAKTIRPGHVWVMGDNRPNSKDSRFFGDIDEHLIVGRAFVRVWPVGSLSLL